MDLERAVPDTSPRSALPPPPGPLLALSIFFSLDTGLAGCLCPIRPLETGGLGHTDAWVPSCLSPLSHSRLRATGQWGEREPSSLKPGELPGRREVQRPALSPESQGYYLLFHSCPLPWLLGARRKPLLLLPWTRGEVGQQGQPQGGEEWLFKREV